MNSQRAIQEGLPIWAGVIIISTHTFRCSNYTTEYVISIFMALSRLIHALPPNAKVLCIAHSGTKWFPNGFKSSEVMP